MLPRLPDQQIIRRSKRQLFLVEIGAVLASLWELNLLLRRDEMLKLSCRKTNKKSGPAPKGAGPLFSQRQ